MAQTNGVNGVNGVNGHGPTANVSVDEFVKQEYDYLICGGGTAGLCVAARLSENPDVTVGIIEAGKNKLGDPFVDIPAMFLQMLGNPEYDYIYKTVPQEGNKGKVHHIPRGKLLGGSSAINYMMYVRGSTQDYDDWATLAKDPSWSAAEMKQYMLKHETLEPIDEKITDRTTMPFVGEHHGTSGPVRTSFNDVPGFPIDDLVIKAADEVTGYDKKPLDPWSGDHLGFYNTLGAVIRTGPNKGKRSYAGRGYYQANEHRPNLKLVTESTVARVILDDNKAATGVEFITNGQKYTAKAKREVVICGGTIASPQMLELSGIGDPEVLRKAGVECLVPLKSVGNDFQDHSIGLYVSELTPLEGNISADSIYKPEMMEWAQKLLVETQGGPLTSISSVQGFFPATKFLEEGEIDEIIKSLEETNTEYTTDFHREQLKQVAAHLKSDKSANLQMVFIAATAGVDKAVEDQKYVFPPPEDLNAPNGITLAICLQYPASRGYIHIKSSDPFEHPEINPRYLEHPADVAVLAAGLKFCDKVMYGSKALEGKIGKRINPKPEFDLGTIKGRREAMQDWVLGEYHVCGSCAMGSTVDSRLRVNGVKNLRVADASTFPNNVSGNIQSSVYAIAEKAADMIKHDWDHVGLKKVVA